MLFLIPAARALSRRFGETSPVVGFGVVCIALAFLTSRYAPVWKSDVGVWFAGVRADPNGYYAAMQLAEAYRGVKMLAEAKEQAVRALELNRADPRIRTILGLIQKDSGDYGEAEENLLEVVKGGKGADIAAGHLAKLYVDLLRPDDAVRMLKTAAERDPANAAIHLQNAAVVLVQFNRRTEALALLEGSQSAIESAQSPEAQRAWFYMGELYRETGAVEKAKAAYSKFIERTQGLSGETTRRLREQAEAALRGL
jgi:tetratricopeptide (TPR) repeat protein